MSPILTSFIWFSVQRNVEIHQLENANFLAPLHPTASSTRYSCRGKNVKSDQSHSIQRQTKRKNTSTWKYRKFFELQHPTASTTSKSGRKCHQFWLVSFDSACDETLKYPNLKIQNFWRHYIHQRLGHGRHYFLTVIRRINNAGCHWYLQSHLPAR